ncbi:MAG: diadenylate cyclase CdaA [Thermodesulfobacteriota bacterium]|nr:MAG: diadenylate cyclase CdaA [Thermodesulfobacteriota bacterium]
MLETIFRAKNFIALLDILIVAFFIYWLMVLVRGTRAEKMLWGLGVVIIAYFVSLRAELITFHWILSNFLGSIVIFVIVVFQQDIRRGLVQMGRPFITRETHTSQEVLDEVLTAVKRMSTNRTGGLIVFERIVDLAPMLDTGVEVDARASAGLILAIFDVGSPMHDGAVVIKGSRIFKAGCILPLSTRHFGVSMGTRHRAALGLAEETDAVAVVVSEETGEIALAVDYELHRAIKPEELLGALREVLPAEEPSKTTFWNLFPWKIRA